MIVRAREDGVLLMTQPRHAALAADVMRNWSADGLPASSRWASVLLATAEHDNGWLEVDRAPLQDAATGEILDFVHAPVERKHEVWPRGVDRLSGDPYAAALVAQHALTIYARQRGRTEWGGFFRAMEERRAGYMAAAGATESELAADYFFVRAGDLASLIFCNGWTDPEEHGQYTMRLAGSRLEITPDPFGGHEVPLAANARLLPNRPYTGEHDLREAFDCAPEVLLTGVATGARRT